MTDILPRLTRQEERALLDLARRAVVARLEMLPPPRLHDPPPRPLLPQGPFVSLHRGPRLRGCVGMVLAEASLIETVVACAGAAATDDPRFHPLNFSDP